MDNDINSNPISSLDIYQGYDKKIQSALCEQSLKQLDFLVFIFCSSLVERDWIFSASIFHMQLQ